MRSLISSHSAHGGLCDLRPNTKASLPSHSSHSVLCDLRSHTCWWAEWDFGQKVTIPSSHFVLCDSGSHTCWWAEWDFGHFLTSYAAPAARFRPTFFFWVFKMGQNPTFSAAKKKSGMTISFMQQGVARFRPIHPTFLENRYVYWDFGFGQRCR